jgi:PAS domain S-box-containing protein
MDRVRDFMRKLLVSGVQNSGEVAYRYLHPDGKMRHFLNRMTCVPEELPGRFLISGVLIDITAIREAEQKATNYGHRLTETFGQINDGFFSVDPELRLEYCNPRFESLMSFSKEAVTGKSWGDIFYSPDFQRLEKEIQSAYQTRRQARIESLFPSLKKWFRISIYPGPDSTAVFFHDITGEKLAQHEARMARQNLSALINNTQDQIWSVNPDYELVSANQPFLDRVKSITGRTLGIGDLVLDTNYREEDLITWKNYYDQVLSGESFEQLLTLSLEKMPDRFLEVRFYPIFGENNEVVAAGCFSRDITQRIQDQKRIAEQNSRLLEIHDLQSHNIRNHVATILALTSQFDFVNQAHPFNAEIIRFVEGESQKLDDKIHQVVRAANYAMDLQKEIFNHPQVEEGDSPEA